MRLASKPTTSMTAAVGEVVLEGEIRLGFEMGEENMRGRQGAKSQG